MRQSYGLVCVFVLAASAVVAPPASAQLDAGIVLWRYNTALEATSATDYDGSDATAEARVRNWDKSGSGIGARVTYRFSALGSVFGTLGATQVTVRDENLADADLDTDSRGFDDDLYFQAGVQLSSQFPTSAEMFWGASLKLSTFSSDLEESVTHRWDYDEFALMIDGTLGYKVRGIGLYGGLRFAWVDANLDETNSNNLPGLQVRTTELERDGQVDLLLGTKIGSDPLVGFFELGVVGTFSAETGIALQF
jgi:hypothetical protein